MPRDFRGIIYKPRASEVSGEFMKNTGPKAHFQRDLGKVYFPSQNCSTGTWRCAFYQIILFPLPPP